METLNDGCDGIYDGQSNCSTVVATMRGLGFVTRSSCNSSRSFGQGSGCEGNFVFRNIRCGATCGRDPTVASEGGRGSCLVSSKMICFCACRLKQLLFVHK